MTKVLITITKKDGEVLEQAEVSPFRVEVNEVELAALIIHKLGHQFEVKQEGDDDL